MFNTKGESYDTVTSSEVTLILIGITLVKSRNLSEISLKNDVIHHQPCRGGELCW